MAEWDKLDDSGKRNCYESYCSDMQYEHSDNAQIMTYIEWCAESEKLGEPYGVCI